jgi:transcriptional regulator with XRE-family HTH domain
MWGEKIRMIREIRGYSQEYMACQLGMAQNSYSKIETGQTKLTVERLKNVADVLEVSSSDIISREPAIINFKGDQWSDTISPIRQMLNIQCESLEKIIAAKDEEIKHLKEIISGLLKLQTSLS